MNRNDYEVSILIKRFLADKQNWYDAFTYNQITTKLNLDWKQVRRLTAQILKDEDFIIVETQARRTKSEIEQKKKIGSVVTLYKYCPEARLMKEKPVEAVARGIAKFLIEHPAQSGRQIMKAMRDYFIHIDNNLVYDVLQKMLKSKMVKVEKGARNANLYTYISERQP